MGNEQNQQSDVTGIILAAGRGTRLGMELPADSKALLQVAGEPLLAYAFSFLRALKISRRIVVTNGRAEVEDVVRRLDADAEVVGLQSIPPGNVSSLLAAFEKTTGDVLVMNVDHLYDLDVATKSLKIGGDRITVFGDFQKKIEPDERGIRAGADGRIQDISKQLEGANVVCVGLTYIPAAARETYLRAIPATREERGERTGYEDVLQTLARQGEVLMVGDASGMNPYEIDTQEEWKAAEAGVSREQNRFLRS